MIEHASPRPRVRYRRSNREAAGSLAGQGTAAGPSGFLAEAADAKGRLQALVEKARKPETNRLWRRICRWWKELEVLIVTGATTAKVEANNTAVKHIKSTSLGFTNASNYKTLILLRSAARTAAYTPVRAEDSPRTAKNRFSVSRRISDGYRLSQSRPALAARVAAGGVSGDVSSRSSSQWPGEDRSLSTSAGGPGRSSEGWRRTTPCPRYRHKHRLVP